MNCMCQIQSIETDWTKKRTNFGAEIGVKCFAELGDSSRASALYVVENARVENVQVKRNSLNCTFKKEYGTDCCIIKLHPENKK